MSILRDIVSRKAKERIKIQQQPNFPLRYDTTYGPYTPITSIEKSYRRNFINLLLTSPGEWPMSPGMGVGLKHFLFENPGSEKLLSLAPTIRFQLKRYLPQIELFDLNFDFKDEDIDNNRVKIILSYVILGSTGVSTSFAIPSPGDVVSVEDISRTHLQAMDVLNRFASITNDVERL